MQGLFNRNSKYSYVVVACALSLIILGLGWTRLGILQEKLMAEFRDQLRLSVSQTEKAIQLQSTAVFTDPNLSESLEWKLEHAINTSMNEALSGSDIATLALFDEKCQLYTSVGNKGLANCKPKKFGLRWDGKDKLSFAQPVYSRAGTAYQGIAVVSFDSTWLQAQTFFAERIDSLGITLDTVEEGSAFQGTKISNDVGPEIYLSRSDFQIKAQILGQDSFGLSMTVVAIVSIWLMSVLGIRAQNEHKEEISHQHTKISTLLHQLGYCGEIPASIETTLNEFMVEYRNQRQGAAKKIAELDLNVRRLEQTNRNHKKHLDDLVTLESLGLQLRAGVSKLRSDLQQIHSSSEDILDIIVHGASRTLQRLVSSLRSWELEIKLKGSRRLLKTLAETTLQDGSSLFDEQLKLLLKNCDELEDQLLHASSFGQRLGKDCKEADRIGAHWFELSEGSELSAPATSLLDIVIASQALVLNASKAAPRFSNNFDLGTAAQSFGELSIPRPIWLSIVFHLNMAIIDEMQGASQEIRSSLQQGVNVNRLVMSAKFHDVDESVSQRIKQSHHISVAERLAKRCQLTVEILRSQAGTTVATAVSWPHAEGLVTSKPAELNAPS